MRRLRALLHGLPADAAWRRLDPQRPDWTTGDYLMARQIEATERLAWITEIQATTKEKRGQVKPPTPIPRPGADQPKRTQGATTTASKGDWKSKLAGKATRVEG